MTAAAWWTPADGAELDLLLDELTRGYFEHRASCERCRRCPTADGWIAHRSSCWSCSNGIRVTAGAWEVCPCYLERLEHAHTCPACLGACPAVRTAIDTVLDWRRRRILTSKAAYLRLLEETRRVDPAGRVHVVFDDHGEVVEFALRSLTTAAPTRAPEREEAA